MEIPRKMHDQIKMCTLNKIKTYAKCITVNAKQMHDVTAIIFDLRSMTLK